MIIDKQFVNIEPDARNSWFSIPQKEKSRVFDMLVNFYSKPGDRILIPLLYSENYVYGCLSINREVSGYLINDSKKSFIYTANRQINSIDIKDSLKECSNSLDMYKYNMMYSDFPSLKLASKLGIFSDNKDDLYDHVLSYVTNYYNNMAKRLVPGSYIIVNLQNIVKNQYSDVYPLVFDFMNRFSKNTDIVFKGEQIWVYTDKDNYNRRSEYNCMHRYALKFQKK
jgi:hypothetical protein